MEGFTPTHCSENCSEYTRCSGCGSNEWYQFIINGPQGLAGYTIQAGDRLLWRQWQNSTAVGGINIQFTDWSESAGNTFDQDGQDMNADGFHNSWHYRRVDLSPHAGKTINQIRLSASPATQPGFWDIYYQDLVLISADSTVRPIYTRQKTISLSGFGSSGMSGTGYEVNHIAPAGQWPDATTAYYHGDHLGSSRLTSSENGYPVWSATYLPYGQEWNPQITVNHYKFTGKERDTQSGLDNFGARYYASTLGRFVSVDPLSRSASPALPQTWNRYTYTLNNPLKFIDPDGKCSAPAGIKSGQVGICIGSFISAKRIGGVGLGDNRGPVGNDPKATFKARVQLVVVTPDGKVGIEGGSRDGYPSLEVFSYDSKGNVKPILFIPEKKPDDLKPPKEQEIPKKEPK